MLSYFVQRNTRSGACDVTRWGLLLLALVLPITANAQVAPVPQSLDVLRQRGVNSILLRMEPKTIAFLRSNCAVGANASGRNMIVDATKASFKLTTAELCVTVLTRSGRDGTLEPLMLTDGSTPPSLSFDNGFVGAYLRREAVPSGAPGMATLLPVAERCLGQRESNAKLCTSAGYVLGLRAASGETIKAN